MMNWFSKASIKIAIACLMVLIFAACCAKVPEPLPEPDPTPYEVPKGQGTRADLYFYDETGSLAVESRDVDLSYQSQGTYWQVVQQLILGPKGDLLPICPADTAINSVMIYNGLAIVDIGATEMDADELARFRQAVAETLFSTAMAKYTLLTVNGRVPRLPTTLCRAEGVYAKPDEAQAMLAFYRDRSGTKAILRTVALGEDAGIEELIAAIGEENRGEYAISPVGPTVRVSSYTIHGGKGVLSLKGEEQDRPQDMATACLALMLFYSADSHAIDEVTIRYNGTNLTYNGKETLIWEDVQRLCQIEITLYFADSSGKRLIPVQRSISILEPQSRFRIVRSMLQGPKEGDDSDAMPLLTDTRLASTFLGGRIQGKIAILNFERSFYAHLDTLPEDQATVLIYALVNALTEEGSIEQVLFLKNGENVTRLKNGLYLHQPLLRNPGIIIRH